MSATMDWLERVRPSTILGAGAVAVMLPLLATIPVIPLAGDAALVLLSVGSGLGTAWAWNTRRAIERLPLELAPVAATGEVDGVRVYRFRVRLGRGRLMQDPSVRVRFEPASGPPVELAPVVPCSVLCGPFTIVVPDPEGCCEGEGDFVVEVSVRSGGRTWAGTRRYHRGEVGEGRFSGGIARQGARVAWSRDWSSVRAE